MSRSLIEQFTQIKGTDTYSVDMYNQYAEQIGRHYSADTLTVTSGSNTITSISSFTGSEVGNYLVVDSGNASGVYKITGISGNDATVTPTPAGTDASASGRRHNFKNLEDDLNYIRKQLKSLSGEVSWYTDPTSDISSIDAALTQLSSDLTTASGILNGDISSVSSTLSTHLNGASSKHDASEIDVENSYSYLGISGPTDLESALGNINTTVSGLDATNTDIQSELDATQTGVGLNADGTYTPPAGSTFLTEAPSVYTALQTLDSVANAIDNDRIGTQLELDDTQTGAGLTTSGTYSADSGANYIASATSLFNADQLLDAQIKSNSDAITTLSGLVSVDTGALQDEVDATQTGAGLDSDGGYTADTGANYIDSATSLFNADQLLDAQVKSNTDAIGSEITNRTNADSAIQSELDTTQASIGVTSSGTFSGWSGSNYLDAATTVVGGITTLDGQLSDASNALNTHLNGASSKHDASEIDVENSYTSLGISGPTDLESAIGDIDTAVSGVSAAATTAQATADSKVSKSGDTMSGDLQMGSNEVFSSATPTTNNSLVNKLYVDTFASGFKPKASVRTVTETDVPGLYNNGTDGVGATITYEANGALGDIGGVTLVVNNTLLLAGQAESAHNGVYVVTQLGDESNPYILTRREDLDGSPENELTPGTRVYVREGSYAGSAWTLLGADGTVYTVGTDALTWDQTSGEASVGVVQAELDATQSGAGLDTDGSYITIAGANYISGATSLANATELLDTQVKANADAISSEITNRTNADSAIQTELDTTQASIGVTSSGTFAGWSGSNYLDSKTTVIDGITELDTQLDSVSDTLNSHLNGDVNKHDASEIDVEGTYSYLGITGTVGLETAIDSINTTASGLEAADASIQSELDTTQAGAGLDTDGGYTANEATNYISGATSLKNADELLDTQVKTNADAISSEITDRTNADSAIQNELNATQTGAGLTASGTYSADTGANYIDSATSLFTADQALDTALKSLSDNVATLSGSYGAHDHNDLYYTETELNNGQLDNRYYTESEVDALVSGTIDTVNNLDVFKTVTDGSTNLVSSGINDVLTFAAAGNISLILNSGNNSITISGTVEEQYNIDLNWNAGQYWESTATDFTEVPTDILVFVNGVKQKENDSEYYTASIEGGKLKVVLGFESYSTDWVNVVYNRTTTGSSSSGTGLADWVNKTGAYDATNGDRIIMDSTGGTFTINLPASPAMGESVTFLDGSGTCGSNNVTVGRNGSNIMGLAEDMIINTNNAAFELVYYNSSRGWVIFE